DGSTGTTGGGASSGQSVPSRPVLSRISPSAGAPGTWVTLAGTHLTPTTAVLFGAVKAATVRQVSSTEVQALAPPHAPGTVQVVLRTAGGTTAGKRFVYLP
ncbi:MAG: hypothetical protein JWO22_2973, partial [Frankiales bacterium]|nr:hypothetical protein [Frankiales bacterium]